MRTSRRRITPVVFAIMAFALICAKPAEGAEREMIVRAIATQFMPDLSYRTSNDDGFPVEVDSSSDTGWGLGFEVLATSRVGIAFQYVNAAPTVNVMIDARPTYSLLEARDDLDVTMYAASLNLHLTPDRPVDLYVSPVLAYLSFGDLAFSIEDPSGVSDYETFDIKRDLTWGIGVGIDVPFGESGWLATGSVTYLDSTLKIRQPDNDTTESIGFDPLLISAGIGYRF